MNKYGKENFYVELLEDDIPIDLLNEKEIEYIELYDSYYNGYNSTKELSELYNVHPVTIRRVIKTKLKMGKKSRIDEDFIKDNYRVLTIAEMAHYCG